MQTKNIFKTLALAMLMPTMLLTTACSNDDDLANNAANTETVANKGYALPVTVNVTRQDDAASTRATFDGSKLNFTTGDKLLVRGNDNSGGGAGSFAGLLDYDASEGNFSGTIYTENSYSGTADALFTAAKANWVGATLFPNGYETYAFLSISGSGYSTSYSMSYNKAIAATKAAAVEQFSLETAKTYSSGFALSPENAILNFTIGRSKVNDPVEVKLKDNNSLTISGKVTTSSSGLATFAVGVSGTTDLNGLSLTVASNPVTITSSSKTLTAGKIYNIIRIPGSINGLFSVSATKKVVFSKGNLRSMKSGEKWVWSSFSNQYDYYNAYNEYNWDKFCWVGALGALDSEPDKWGISTSKENSDFGTDVDDKLKSDWGYTIGTGWRTPTNDEWTYLLKTRDGATSKYGFATVNEVKGIIILPDVFVDPRKNLNDDTYDFVGKATSNYGYNGNVYDSDGWADMEKSGAVFLPAAGDRYGVDFNDAGTCGYYWSSTAAPTTYFSNAYLMSFGENSLSIGDNKFSRGYGLSVRLVRDAN